MNLVVTGTKGFIGKNLVVALKRRTDLNIIEYDLDCASCILDEGLAKADVVFHLAGVNRPDRVEEYEEGNVCLTQKICNTLKNLHRSPVIVLSSSSQAVLDNPYGLSKRKAEEIVFGFGRETGASVFVFRLFGVFGKWCRPNYNSVVATFCYNIARELPIAISDQSREIDLVYVDDVVKAFISVMEGRMLVANGKYCQVQPAYRISLGKLAKTIESFRKSRVNLYLPDMNNSLVHALYATYISYLPMDSFSYALEPKSDSRGELAELLKSPHIGQIFISRTRPGIIRGNHYHDTKVEKFVVLEGDAVIRFRHILDENVIEYPVSGRDFLVIDIPPGYTHSIENIGQSDLVVLFWADEIFMPDFPDTYGMTV